MNFASGDRNPIDGESGRFDPLYGATFAFYGYSGYFSWQNMINPALRLSFQPMEKLRCEIIHRGQELDLRASWQATKHLEIEAVFASFFPGEFVEATGPSPGSQFGYLAATLRF